MDLLGFARGPALKCALLVFFFGVSWRVVAMALLRYPRNFNRPRKGLARALLAGVMTTGTRSWPHPEFIKRTGAGEALGYSYHLGLFVVILAFAPHIALFHSITGLSWPALPSALVTVISVVTMTLFTAVLFRRVTSPVMRLISNFDDYFTWAVTASVLITGLAATAHLGGRYATLLGMHVLSLDLLLVWFPCGKLMHAFYIMPSRALNGFLLSRKGAPS